MVKVYGAGGSVSIFRPEKVGLFAGYMTVQ
jgi:hypothetical protein